MLVELLEFPTDNDWAGEEEKYTILDESSINSCIKECKERITFLEKYIKNNIQKKSEYIKYLQSLPKTLSYTEYIDHITGDILLKLLNKRREKER